MTVDKLSQVSSETETWHINNEGLRPGSKLWAARGWFVVVLVTDKGVEVVPDAVAGEVSCLANQGDVPSISASG